MPSLNILLVEDSPNDAKLLLMELRRSGWDVTSERVDSADAMRLLLDKQPWDIIIADYSMPQFSGPAALRLAREFAVDVPFVLVSGTMGEETAVAAMKAGADDYLFKGDLHRLGSVVERELRGAEERRQARKTEQRLRKRESQLTESLRLARLGTWYLNFETNINDWSDQACWLLGKESCTGAMGLEQFRLCIHPDDRDMFNSAFDNVTAPIIALDCRITSPKAAAAFVLIRGNIVRDESGKLIEAGGMIQDITERKLIDAELLRVKDSAEAANRAKSEFLANMSHELRTPMTAILGFADMMLQAGEHAPDYKECVQVIRRNSHHLLELINEILDLSKIEAGEMTVENIRCDLPELLSDVATLMRSRATEKALQFKVSIAGPVPRYIQTDPLRLRQILVNLLGNAIKFTAAGLIEMIVNCKASARSSILQIQVCDTGIGMNEDQLKRVFQPFAQGEESTTRKFGGTGLGLAISRRLARLLKGDVTVTSTVGRGSIFKVEIDSGEQHEADTFSEICNLPIDDAADQPQATEPAIHARILLAEDGRDNQRLLSTHLKMVGADVVIAENGQIAVDLVSAGHFDLILMDMQMPVMDGYTATAQLRKQNVTTPIIALTAYAMSDDRNKCLASGCTDYLTKPVQRETLLKVIRHHLGDSAETTIPQPSGDKPSDMLPQPQGAGPLRSSLLNYPGMAPIIHEFVADLPGQVQQLRSLLETQDLDALRRLVHQLRGACGGYGFDGITEIAAVAEAAIKTGQPVLAISTAVFSLIHIIQRIEGFDTKQERSLAA